MKKGLVIGLAAALVLSFATMGMALTVDGEGSGYFNLTTYVTGGSSLHDQRIINAYHWNIVQEKIDPDNFTVDREITMDFGSSREEALSVPEDMPNILSYRTVYTGSESTEVYNRLETYRSCAPYCGPPEPYEYIFLASMKQDYEAGASVLDKVDSYFNSSSGTFETWVADTNTFIGNPTPTDFYYKVSHTRVTDENSQNKDKVRISASSPKMDWISSGEGAHEISIYAWSSYLTDIDGLILPITTQTTYEARGMFSNDDPGNCGFNRPTYAQEVKDELREGTVFEYTGNLFNHNIAELPNPIIYDGEWNLCHTSAIGFTIEKY